MVWSDKIENYVKAHVDDDVRLLALAHNPIQGEELRTALIQIELRQRTITKLPRFSSTPGIRFPSRLAAEQCSSERCAFFKCGIIGSHCKKGVDLTGGMGIDTIALASVCDQMTYIEQNPDLCQAARHNFALLAPNVTVCNMMAEEWLDSLSDDDRFDFIFIDPARRDNHGGKVFRIADCTPDISFLLPRLTRHALKVMVKLSPMLDISECIEALNPESLTIVSLNNECKELIAVVSPHSSETLVEAVELGRDTTLRMSFTLSEEYLATPLLASDILPGMTIAEPYAGFMKSGAWKTLCHRFNARMIAPSSHLYLTDGPFPGRCFTVTDSCLFTKRDASMILKGNANITVRNFPMSVSEVRHRFGTLDGGDRYIFLTTDNLGRKLIIQTIRNKQSVV